ncbi:kinase domain [Cryptosporidium bovis]|uniref:kinase domain n=1 Tax=Cryptosporidium bovis TaxID=310047 RepID=UPI00351A240C|nr:kinase domain [Cryptosporidium bovis]
MHNGASRAISTAMLQQSKCFDRIVFSNIESNSNDMSTVSERVCAQKYYNDLDFKCYNQRPILSQNYTPPQTPKNVRYVSLLPISRMQYIRYDREPNLLLGQNYGTTTTTSSMYSRHDCPNIPTTSFKCSNYKQSMPVIYSSPHSSHMASITYTKAIDSNINEKTVVPFLNTNNGNNYSSMNRVDEINRNNSKVIRNQGQGYLMTGTSDQIYRLNNRKIQENHFKDFELKKEETKEVNQSKDMPLDNKTKMFSQVTSNNHIIEVKKDLIERVPDASDGVLQRLKKTEYIRMEDLVLEPATQRGTFGVVFKGKIKTGPWANRDVAVKRWKFDNESRVAEEHFKSLEREVYAYRSLKHPNICSYIGVCLEPGFYAIITEYLSNGNLFELLYENKVAVSASDRLKISRQLCDAVYFIHSSKMIHRDIKTANVILDSQNNIKLCDFGQARTMNIITKSNTPGIILDENGGSPRYMAPECFFIGKSIDEKSDVWAIACCLLEIFGAPIPFFDYKSNEDVVNAIIVGKQKPKIPKWFHPKIINILSRCFERKPDNRPSSYDILEALRSIKPDEIQRYGMNVKRDLSGAAVASGRNQGCDTKGSTQTGKRLVGNCIGVAQQRRIVVQAPTETTIQSQIRESYSEIRHRGIYTPTKGYRL